MMIDRPAATGPPGRDERIAMLRLLPMNDRDKDLEILALRHQVTVLHIHADAVNRRGCRRNPLGTVLRLVIAWGP